jgi:predicted heme/steroid binding protein
MTENFTPAQDQHLQIAQTKAYYQGLRDGVALYAHWQDGTQYVGTCGRTLAQALDSITQDEQALLERYQQLVKV